MPVLFIFFKHIIVALTLPYLTNILTDCLPISNGFSLKFNPISTKEQVKPKSFGALFAKIPQEFSAPVRNREVLTEAVFAHPMELANGCTNQIAKMLYPLKLSLDNDTRPDGSEGVSFISLPVIKQPLDSYNVLVATAPKNIKLDQKGDALPMVLYVVFPGESEMNQTNNINLPTIYFVNTVEGNMNINKKEKDLPLFIMDNNRTVTGLKSKEVSKFVRFKNKFRNLYDSEVMRE